MTREDFIGRFETTGEAIEFENQLLSSGDEHLPECARSVRDGSEPTSEYWDFACEQSDLMD